MEATPPIHCPLPIRPRLRSFGLIGHDRPPKEIVTFSEVLHAAYNKLVRLGASVE